MGQFSRQSWRRISVVHFLLLWGSFLRKGLCHYHGQKPRHRRQRGDDNNGGNNNAAADDDSNDNDEKEGDNDDNCRFDSNDAIFFVSAPLLFDLPFLTTFVGVTIEIDGLHLLEELASDGV